MQLGLEMLYSLLEIWNSIIMSYMIHIAGLLWEDERNGLHSKTTSWNSDETAWQLRWHSMAYHNSKGKLTICFFSYLLDSVISIIFVCVPSWYVIYFVKCSSILIW